MSWRQSSFGKTWTSVSSYGLRAGLQDALARWAKTRLRVPQDVCGDYGWILTPDRPARLSAPDSGPFRINWLVPGIGKGIGGLFNVFRAILQLESWGHKNRVYSLESAGMTSAQATELVRKHYFPIQAEVEAFSGHVEDSDALVATSWKTTYAARGLGNTARKFYFVQDLEHLFHPEGSLCEFARETYRWGFYGITAGAWIAGVLNNEFGMQCSPFGFAYDHDIYSVNGARRFADTRKRVLFYARPSTERRGFELGVLALSRVAEKMPEVEFVLVGFPPRSITLPFRAVLPGILEVSELPALYRSCTIALVLSHTNLSLLPLELMACGCGVVSNAGPNVDWLLSEQVAQLAAATPEALANGMLAMLNDENLRARKVSAALALANSSDWVSEIKRIESGFYQGLNVAFLDMRHA